MWYRDEILFPRFFKSVLWMIVMQTIFVGTCTLCLKLLSWNPLLSLNEWLFSVFHWKTIFYQCILALTLIGFGIVNIQLCTVEKHISGSRYEKLKRAFSVYCFQHLIIMILLGGLAAYCYVGIFRSLIGKGSLFDVCFSLRDTFDGSFVITHGSYTGLMFSLKYFICDMYLIKFASESEHNQDFKIIENQIKEAVKDSFYCILKAVHWFYLVFIIFGLPLKSSDLDDVNSDSYAIAYNLLNPRLFLSTLVSGFVITTVWNIYILLFNAFATQHYIFPIKVSVQNDKRALSSALTSNGINYIKYLAALDLRILAQHDMDRRRQLFSISNPGGHPHEWNAISKICISSLQDFVTKLYECSLSAADTESKSFPTNVDKYSHGIQQSQDTQITLYDKIYKSVREKPLVSYFLDEFPNAKLIKLFATSQLYIWMIDALGYLLAFSYTEDKYGVVQQSLPDIIRLLLDLKMAEEKMPIGLVGIKTNVRDPQGRYEHIHQRLTLKITVHNSLSRIANIFNEDLKEILLPPEYQRYLLRYLNQKS